MDGHSLRLAMFIAVFFGPVHSLFADGKLEQIRSSVRSTESDKKCDDDTENQSCWDDGSGSAVGDCIGEVFFVLVYDGSGELTFPAYPYSRGIDGYAQNYQSLPKYDLEIFSECSRGHHWSGRFWLEGGTDFDDLSRGGVGVMLLSGNRVGLLTDHHVYLERGPGGSTDTLSIGRTELIWNNWGHEQLMSYVGIGFRDFIDSRGSDYGVSLSYGLDVFPRKPFVVSGSVSVGSLRSASVFEGRCSVGYLLNRSEAYAGFHFLKIDRTELYGPMLGFRIWF